MLLSIAARYLKVRRAALIIVGPLFGLVCIILLPTIGAVTIIPLMLYRAGQAVSQANARGL